MAESTIAVDGLETLKIALNFTAKVTLNGNLLCGNAGNNGTDLLRRELLGTGVGIDVGLFQDALGGLEADTVNVNERSFDALVAWNFYAEESWHDRGSVCWMVALGILKAYNAGLALALFVTGILADNAHHIIAANDFAGFAKTFNGGSDFHWKNGRKFTTAGAVTVVSLWLAVLEDWEVAG